jgi:hypothetical protein
MPDPDAGSAEKALLFQDGFHVRTVRHCGNGAALLNATRRSGIRKPDIFYQIVKVQIPKRSSPSGNPVQKRSGERIPCARRINNRCGKSGNASDTIPVYNKRSRRAHRNQYKRRSVASKAARQPGKDIFRHINRRGLIHIRKKRKFHIGNFDNIRKGYQRFHGGKPGTLVAPQRCAPVWIAGNKGSGGFSLPDSQKGAFPQRFMGKRKRTGMDNPASANQ